MSSLAAPALAQDEGSLGDPRGERSPFRPAAPAPAAPAKPASKPSSAAATADDAPIGFEADTVDYDDADTVTAKGNVVLRRDDRSARADVVTWNRGTGKIVATGNVVLVDEDGNRLFTERADLTDQLDAGAMKDMLLAFREGGRVAAVSGERDAKGRVTLEHAAYTACEVENAQGCPKRPTWRIEAARVVYTPDDGRVAFTRARLHVFGLVPIPLPGLALHANGQPTSGLLVPSFRSSNSNGVELGASYYWLMAPNRDLTVNGYVFTKAPPMVSGQYRQLTDKGAFQITGYATTSRRVGVASGGDDTGSEHSVRGYVFANGRLQLSEHWSVSASLRRASDRTFLRRYYITDDDRLRSTFDVERIDDTSYLSVAGWATQTLRVGTDQGQVPLALPEIDYRRRLADPLLGGRIELEANTLALARSQGQDTQRAFASAQWQLRRILPWGQSVALTGLLRGDVYHSDDNALTDTLLYRGEPGWRGRGIAIGAIDVMWPLVGPVLGGTQVLTPRIQVVATPHIRNLAIPDEDSRAIDLEDSNLFALNRFPGYDRIEDGVRFTYGLDWQLDRPDWRVKGTIGQSYRLSSQPTLAPDGTGITSRLSDIVGRVEVRYRDFIQFTERYRIDKDSYAVRRNEFDAAIGSHRTYVELGYVRLNRDIAQDLEDLPDREELRAAARIAFLRYWSVFGSGVINLTSRAEDPSAGNNGFQPLRTRFGVGYTDDCIDIGFTWRRDYTTTGDAKKGNIFSLSVRLKNLGFH